MIPLEEEKSLEFEEILDRAKEQINSIYPVWTNYNPADSGMALLELFAYMTELQQFHNEQIGDSHLHAFLHLFGMKPARMKPARAYVKVEGVKEPFSLLRGTKAKAGNTVFEAEQTVYVERDDSIVKNWKQYFYPFGENPESESDYEILLRYELEEDVVYTLYFELVDEYAIKRNPIDENLFIPMVQLELEYYDGTAYVPCEIIKDTTFGLLQTGMVQFQLKGRMEKSGEYYRLRLHVTGEYDTAPCISEMHFNMIPFSQRDTILEQQEFILKQTQEDFYEVVTDSWNMVYGESRIYRRTEQGYKRIKQYSSYVLEGKKHFVFTKEIFSGKSNEIVLRLVAGAKETDWDSFTYKGNGMPGQQFFLPDHNVSDAFFAVWVEEEENTGYFLPWFSIQDFAQAGSGDRCYVLDEEKGILKFGNGKQGIMPKGRIEVTAYAICEGEAGNVKKNQISAFCEEKRAESLYNLENAEGGKNKESIEECLKRYRKEENIKNRAVTNEDYKQIMKRTPGLRIKKVRVTPSAVWENSLEVMVQPFTNGKRILQGNAYEKNILRFLEKRKMLGTNIIIKKPEYISISLNLEVMVKSRYLEMETRLQECIQKYFDEYMDFGKTITYSRLYGYIDALPETAGICELEVYARGKGVVRDENKNIDIPFYGMAYLDEVQIRCVLTDE